MSEIPDGVDRAGVFEVDQGDYTLQLNHLRAELGQPPLDDGTPLTRTLALTTLHGRYRTASLQHGQLVSVSGDTVNIIKQANEFGLLKDFFFALLLPRNILPDV